MAVLYEPWPTVVQHEMRLCQRLWVQAGSAQHVRSHPALGAAYSHQHVPLRPTAPLQGKPATSRCKGLCAPALLSMAGVINPWPGVKVRTVPRHICSSAALRSLQCSQQLVRKSRLLRECEKRPLRNQSCLTGYRCCEVQRVAYLEGNVMDCEDSSWRQATVSVLVSQKRRLQHTVVAHSIIDCLPDMATTTEQLITKAPCIIHAVSHCQLHGCGVCTYTRGICPKTVPRMRCVRGPCATACVCILRKRQLQTRAPTTVELCQSCKCSTSGSLPVTTRNSSAALLKNMNRSMSSGCTGLHQHAVMAVTWMSAGKVGTKGRRTALQ
jgi:hypothetical protein